MEIRSQQEALFIACEMEKSAIQLYTRALMLLEQQGRADDPIPSRFGRPAKTSGSICGSSAPMPSRWTVRWKNSSCSPPQPKACCSRAV